jgi:carbon-monoxide dehydrogenase large subunit
VLFDEDGNPTTNTLASYPIVSITEVPSFDLVTTETPTSYNPLGAKGIGEASTIGSTPAVQNAVIDALVHLGVRHIDLPCSSQNVWRTIRDAEAGTLADPWSEPPSIFDRLSGGQEVDEAGVNAAEGI